MAKKQYADAIAKFSDLLKVDSHCAECFLNRGLCLCWSGRAHEGIADFNHVLKLDPKSYAARVHRASAYIQLGEPNRALQDAEEAIKMRPKLDPGYVTKARALAAGGKHVEAQAVLKSALSKVAARQNIDQATQQIAMDEAFFHFKRHDLKLASQAVERVPNWNRKAALLNFHANYLRATGKGDQAMREIGQAIALDPKNDEYYLTRAQWLATEPGKYKLSQADLARASHRDARYFSVKSTLAAFHGNLDEAQEAIDRAISMDPTDEQLQLVRANLQIRCNKLTSAAADLSRFLAVKPKCFDCYKLLAKIHQQSHDLDSALKTLNTAVEQAEHTPGLAAALEARGDFLYDTGDDHAALKDFDRAISLGAGSASLAAKRVKVVEEIGSSPRR